MSNPSSHPITDRASRPEWPGDPADSGSPDPEHTPRQRHIAALAEHLRELAAHAGTDAEPLAGLADWSTEQREQLVALWLDDLGVDAAGPAAFDAEVFARLVLAHLRLGWVRRPGESQVELLTPSVASDGWSDRGRTLLLVVTDDRPFLVDTLSMALSGAGWRIHELVHPQLLVERDADGRLRHMERRTPSEQAAGESWILAEVTPPYGQSVDAVGDALRADVEARLRDVELATDDFRAMLACLAMAEVEAEAAPRPQPVRDEVRDFLRWLREGNFTLLGEREYAVDPDTGAFTPVPGSGLGILREVDGREVTDGFDARVAPGDSATADLLVVTKDSQRATVHRPTWLDYVGLRRFDAAGRVVGERRFLGLLGANAYTESVWRVPMVRAKAAEVMERAGHLPGSHSAAQVRGIIATYPRDELFHASPDELFQVVDAVSRLRERQQLRLFVRMGRWGRFVSCLVYFPRDRYDTRSREQMMDILMRALGGESIEYQAMVSESVLARLYFNVRLPVGAPHREVDVRDLERQLTEATTSWDDRFEREVGDLPSDERGIEFSRGYREEFPPAEAVADLLALNRIEDARDIAFRVRPPLNAADPSDLRVRMLRRGAHMQLSEVMPHLTSLGLRVVDEWPYDLVLRGEPAVLYDFGVAFPPGIDAAAVTEADTARLTGAFAASYRGRVGADGFNELVVRAGLTWRQVALLRAIAGYLQQLRSQYSTAYMARALVAHPELAASLVRTFELRFDPERQRDAEGDDPAAAEAADIRQRLDAVDSLDHDRIVRQFLAVIEATDRTNWYASPTPLDTPQDALALKIRPRDIAFAPEPRPLHEIYVHGPLVHGVHLRFGDVARGGLRWSDRGEDFRTEVLGLAKAQMVKNSVIVPVGAKGGFVPQQLPDPAVDRPAWQAAGVEAYQCFIRALLSVTDDIDADGSVVPPQGVVRHDGDDPYLVVAADKGTATFSDIANQVAIDHGFWLGDAFASGGSEGYDHKAMGITARGAWESVKRHFHEMGVDCQTTDFTCVGIGDMAGDVFGNGMLLSRHTRLVAAFNHQHVFIDPTPDAESSFGERERLFALPRSTWADYDASLISEGGGVFERSAKSIPVSPQAREALGIEGDAESLTPTELITAILKAPVDLLWNGGIGTYVKAASETNADVGDRANDAVRVNGGEVRAKVAGEGGNLGWTQRGRIEYAQRGGRINTDFIDNSAGVDTSDHEVNIKILLAAEVAAGRLTMEQRNELLPTMTDEVAGLVLQHNIDQNSALSDAVSGAVNSAGVHEMWMERLEQAGYLDRELDVMPSASEMARRIANGQGLTNPELATLLSWTKIWMEDEVLASDLPDDPFVADRLIAYFPKELQERYRDQMPQHRLHREIITTVAVNRYVHSQGIAAYHRRSEVTGASPAQVIRAQLAARTIFAASRIERVAARSELPASVGTRIRGEVRHMVDRACRLLLRRGGAQDVRGTIDRYRDGIGEVFGLLPDVLDTSAAAVYDQTASELRAAGVNDELVARVSCGPVIHEALSITDIADDSGRRVEEVARLWFALVDRLRLRELRARVDSLPHGSRWEIMARASMQDDLYAIEEALVAALVAAAPAADGEPAGDPRAAVDAWLAANPHAGTALSLLDTLDDDEGLAPVSVAVRTLRTLA